MRVLLKFAVRIAANAGALALLLRYVDGFTITPREFAFFNAANISPAIQTLLVGGLMLAIVYTFIRPILRFLSFPIRILTFGLFNSVLSIFLLVIADWLLGSLTVSGVMPLVIGGLGIGIVNIPFDNTLFDLT